MVKERDERKLYRCLSSCHIERGSDRIPGHMLMPVYSILYPGKINGWKCPYCRGRVEETWLSGRIGVAKRIHKIITYEPIVEKVEGLYGHYKQISAWGVSACGWAGECKLVGEKITCRNCQRS